MDSDPKSALCVKFKVHRAKSKKVIGKMGAPNHLMDWPLVSLDSGRKCRQFYFFEEINNTNFINFNIVLLIYIFNTFEAPNPPPPSILKFIT